MNTPEDNPLDDLLKELYAEEQPKQDTNKASKPAPPANTGKPTPPPAAITFQPVEPVFDDGDDGEEASATPVPGMPGFVIDPEQMKKLKEIAKKGVKQAQMEGEQAGLRLHRDWNKAAALIREISCGNYSIQGALSWSSYEFVRRTAELMDELSEEVCLPPDIQPFLELAALDMIRAQVVRRCNSIGAAGFKAALKELEQVVSPKIVSGKKYA